MSFFNWNSPIIGDATFYCGCANIEVGPEGNKVIVEGNKCGLEIVGYICCPSRRYISPVCASHAELTAKLYEAEGFFPFEVIKDGKVLFVRSGPSSMQAAP